MSARGERGMARLAVMWLLGLAGLGAGGGYGGLWYYVHGRAVVQTEAFIENWRASGFRVSWSSMRSGGFPGPVTVYFEDPVIAAPAYLGGWTWSAEGLDLALWPHDPNALMFKPQGEQSLLAPGRPEMRGRAEGMVARLRSDARGMVRELSVSAREGFAAADDARVADFDALRARARRVDDTYVLTAALERPRMAGVSEASAPARAVAQAEVTAASALEPYRGLDARTLSAWSAAQGGVDVRSACVAWADDEADGAPRRRRRADDDCDDIEGPALDLTGDARLDRAGRWNGEFTLAAREPAAALAHLAELGAIDARAARNAGAMAQAMGGGAVRIPLSIREGALYLFVFEVGAIPDAY